MSNLVNVEVETADASTAEYPKTLWGTTPLVTENESALNYFQHLMARADLVSRIRKRGLNKKYVLVEHGLIRILTKQELKNNTRAKVKYIHSIVLKDARVSKTTSKLKTSVLCEVINTIGRWRIIEKKRR